jgi:hypothetical protein
MDERIKARIQELQQAERKAEIELVALRNMIAELERLLTPGAPTRSGDSLGA